MRRLGVPHLILTHLTDNRPALASCAGKLQMLVQMRHLILSVLQKPQIPLIAQQTRRHPIASEPAYHTGLNTLLCPPNSAMWRSVQARCSVSSHAACLSASRAAGSPRSQRLP